MTLNLTPASTFPISQLADLLTRGFEDYFVPIHITEEVFLTMLRRDSIDLTASRAILEDDEPIGLGLIARRGWTSRLAAMGIVAHARNSGVGTWAMGQLIEEAKARGEKQMLLEVIEQNAAGVNLYEKSGFKKIRRLVGYKIENPQVEARHQLEEMDIYELARIVTRHGLPNLPWQLTGATIAQYTPPARAFHINDAYCLVSDPSKADVAILSLLVKTRSRGAGLSRVLLGALFANFPNKTWRVSPIYPEEMAFIFEQVGMKREDISQWQMSLAL
ncbi:MAG: GNAT family N-acetyltransferase [Chloroflexi bacterium]|nr:GNAT family N-acetyltransferase [Chloroflexota bacterium]MCA2002230.1 GNAT family N-acetyltransferase [Chloroflexota bacterium]